MLGHSNLSLSSLYYAKRHHQLGPYPRLPVASRPAPRQDDAQRIGQKAARPAWLRYPWDKRFVSLLTFRMRPTSNHRFLRALRPRANSDHGWGIENKLRLHFHSLAIGLRLESFLTFILVLSASPVPTYPHPYLPVTVIASSFPVPCLPLATDSTLHERPARSEALLE